MRNTSQAIAKQIAALKIGKKKSLIYLASHIEEARNEEQEIELVAASNWHEEDKRHSIHEHKMWAAIYREVAAAAITIEKLAGTNPVRLTKQEKHSLHILSGFLQHEVFLMRAMHQDVFDAAQGKQNMITELQAAHDKTPEEGKAINEKVAHETFNDVQQLTVFSTLGQRLCRSLGIGNERGR